MGRGIAAVLAAGGRGARFGGRTPKALAPVAGQPLAAHALRALQSAPDILWIVIAAPTAHVAGMRRVASQLRASKVHAIVPGGASRSASVAAAVAALPPHARWVLIHDAARPCLPARLIRSTVQAVKRHGAVACGVPAPMTVKTVDADGIVRLTLDRESLWCVQTPQAFRRDWLQQALELARHNLAQFPDDAAILEWAGYPVRMILGEALNIKVTTKDDARLAEYLLMATDARRS